MKKLNQNIMIKSYTNKEESKTLAGILSIETADMCYMENTGSGNDLYNENPTFFNGADIQENQLPCWSLAALRALLPWALNSDGKTYIFESHNAIDSSWVYSYRMGENTLIYVTSATVEDEINACYEVILKLKKLNVL